MADLAAGDATARQRAHVALCAGASLEEVEEARQLLDTSEEQVGGSSWQGEMMIWWEIWIQDGENVIIMIKKAMGFLTGIYDSDKRGCFRINKPFF